MNADSVFVKGDSHEVCQDYAVENNGNNSFVVIADGCSSSKNTDIGARIIAHKAKLMLKECYNFNAAKNFELLALISEAMVEGLGLPSSALDATVGMVYRNGGEFNAFLHGDGAIVIKDKDSKIPHLHYLDYAENMPYYVSYYLDDTRNKMFKECETNHKSWHSVYFNDDGTLNYRQTLPFSETEYRDVFGYVGEIAKTDWVAVLSDGFFSFTEPNQGNPKQRRNIPFEEYYTDFFNFKSFKGEFAKRRLVAFLRNKKDLGWEHYDDLSMGVLHFDE